MTTALISHPDCLLHNMGKQHPEAPERINAIKQALFNSKAKSSLIEVIANKVAINDLLRVHSQQHIDNIFRQSPNEGWKSLDADTIMNPHTLEAALYAAGAQTQAVDLVLKNKAKHAFCLVRPPGHHAERDKAMGFCFFNNIAVGAAYALEQYALERIAILDFDVHHGNGTQDIFYDDKRVLFCSSFQHPHYPYPNIDDTNAHMIHVPLENGCDSHAFRQAISQSWLPALESYQPQLIFVSAGFDAHQNDPLAEVNLSNEDYHWLGQFIQDAADNYCQGKYISTLEGGYDLTVLAECVCEYLSIS